MRGTKESEEYGAENGVKDFNQWVQGIASVVEDKRWITKFQRGESLRGSGQQGGLYLRSNNRYF